MVDKSLKDRFLNAVAGLNLTFPVAEISEKTGYGQPTVSVYVSGKTQVSIKFLRKFCEVFALDYEAIKSGVTPVGMPQPVPITVDVISGILQKQNALLEVLTNTMARQNSILERQATEIESKIKAVDQRTQGMEINLTEALTGVESISIRQDSVMKEIHGIFLKVGAEIPPSPGVSKKGNEIGEDGGKKGKKV